MPVSLDTSAGLTNNCSLRMSTSCHVSSNDVTCLLMTCKHREQVAVSQKDKHRQLCLHRDYWCHFHRRTCHVSVEICYSLLIHFQPVSAILIHHLMDHPSWWVGQGRGSRGWGLGVYPSISCEGAKGPQKMPISQQEFIDYANLIF